ncbi:MAG TPA: hypothetical protein VLQ29_06530 [Candidatus Dormibacteraeota bacterium]|nr:hypothetical protein [Candidatus Dormibacteraeota bacterium]
MAWRVRLLWKRRPNSANAFEAKIDNKITANIKEFFVFMPTPYALYSFTVYDASVGFCDDAEG